MNSPAAGTNEEGNYKGAEGLSGFSNRPIRPSTLDGSLFFQLVKIRLLSLGKPKKQPSSILRNAKCLLLKRNFSYFFSVNARAAMNMNAAGTESESSTGHNPGHEATSQPTAVKETNSAALHSASGD